MRRDVPLQIINESVKRLVDQSMEHAGDEIGLPELPDCPFFGLISPDQLKRMAAFGVVMMRIIQSASWN